jgi:hypothetical protein
VPLFSDKHIFSCNRRSNFSSNFTQVKICILCIEWCQHIEFSRVSRCL